MKNLITAAGYYTGEELPQEYRTPTTLDFIYKDLKSKEKIIAELRKYTSWNVDVYYRTFTEKETYTDKTAKHVDSFSYIFLTNDKTIMQLYSRKYKYYFCIPFFMQYKLNVKYVKDTTKDLLVPNAIGVFTVKKIEDWFSYIYEKYTTWTNAQNIFEQRNKDIENQITEKVKIFKDQGAKIYTWHNSVDIELNHFEINLKHEKDSAYLYTTIKYSGSIEDVQNLLNIK